MLNEKAKEVTVTGLQHLRYDVLLWLLAGEERGGDQMHCPRHAYFASAAYPLHTHHHHPPYHLPHATVPTARPAACPAAKHPPLPPRQVVLMRALPPALTS